VNTFKAFTCTCTMSNEDIPAIAGGNSHSVNLRLTEFWCDAPHAWFKATEALFRLRGITDDAVKYSLLLTALPRDAFRAISHLIGDGDEVEDNAYATLKAALISSHVLSNYQRVEMLSKVEPLGGRRPSELLTTMLELCPKGEETSSFFCYFFLQRLPREIRVLLAEEDPSNMRAIADKADKLVALHSPQGHDIVAAAAADTGSDEEEATAAAAVKYSQRGSKKFSKKKQQSSRHAARDDSVDRGGKKTNLCFYHAKFGDKAHKCQPHCSWAEN
jgi:hypothetical protein